MLIRKAKIEDSKIIASLLLLAMEEIVYEFIGINSTNEAKLFLEKLTNKKANQYSYENCWIVESKTEIIAAVNIYDGAKLKTLRAPVIKLLKSEYKRNYNYEAETKAGEFYIDSIGVHPNYQGNGIGSKILQFLIGEYTNNTLGLLVDKDNTNAKKLYLKLGFKPVEKITFARKSMEHLQLKTTI